MNQSISPGPPVTGVTFNKVLQLKFVFFPPQQRFSFFSNKDTTCNTRFVPKRYLCLSNNATVFAPHQRLHTLATAGGCDDWCTTKSALFCGRVCLEPARSHRLRPPSNHRESASGCSCPETHQLRSVSLSISATSRWAGLRFANAAAGEIRAQNRL